MGTITLTLGIVSGWLLIAGIGELWLKILRKYSRREQELSEGIISLCLCRTIGPLPIILLLMGIEYSIGLGKDLSLFLAPLILLSLWVYYKNWKESTWEEKKIRVVLEIGFLLSIIYVIFIFWNSPHIEVWCERASGLCHLLAMSSGEKLPAIHPWFPPFPADEYYRGLFYAGGLLTRLCNLIPAHSYYSGYALCVGWISYALLSCLWLLSKKKIVPTIIIYLVLMLGSNFAPFYSYFTHKETGPVVTARYLGGSLSTNTQEGLKNLTPFGQWLAEELEAQSKQLSPDAHPNDLATETLAYSIILGDWHPMMGGFLLISIILSAIAALIVTKTSANLNLAAATLGACGPAMLVVNPWLLPMAAPTIALVALIWLVSQPKGHQVGLTIAITALVTSCILIIPLTNLTLFSFRGADESIELISKVSGAPLTPPLGWVIVASPAALWAILALLSLPFSKRLSNLPNAHGKHDSQWLGPITGAIITLTLIVICETLFMNDLGSHNFERFNSYNKWVPTLLIISTSLCAPFALTSGDKWIKIIAVVIALLLTVPHARLISVGYGRVEPNLRGDFSGAGWIKNSPARPLYQTLLEMPPGVVLEYEHADFSNFAAKAIMPLLTGHNNFVGWSDHLRLWIGAQHVVINDRVEKATKFYQGTLPNANKWAIENGIDYILWSTSLQEKHKARPHKFQTPKEWKRNWTINNEMLQEDYTWYKTQSDPRIEGMWIKKDITKAKLQNEITLKEDELIDY
jgi:hypothetical protein